jgi:hypothetical protein
MSRVDQIRQDAIEYGKATELLEQRFYARKIGIGCHATGESMHKFLKVVPEINAQKLDNEMIPCPECGKEFKGERGVLAHRSIKHKKEASK